MALTKRLHLENFNPGKLRVLYVVAFFLALTTAATAYVQSAYLSKFIDQRYVGLMFSVSNVFILIAAYKIPRLTKSFGRRASFLGLAGGLMICLLLLAVWTSLWPVLISWILYNIFAVLIWILYDVIVEQYSRDKSTGAIRGLSLTIINAGWVLMPIVAGSLVDRFSYGFLYLFAALFAVPVIMIFTLNFKKLDEVPAIPIKSLPWFWTAWRRHAGLKRIFILAFYLQAFFSWMVIYLPLYLLAQGFSWTEIGRMFTVMLLPFVILQYPTGRLMDKYANERPLLILGLVVMSMASFAIYFYGGTAGLGLWMFMLFMSRVGASFFEVARDSYFFKVIDQREIRLIELFRSTAPLAYLISPLVASVTLWFLPLPGLFLILGLFMLTGLVFALTLPATR